MPVSSGHDSYGMSYACFGPHNPLSSRIPVLTPTPDSTHRSFLSYPRHP